MNKRQRTAFEQYFVDIAPPPLLFEAGSKGHGWRATSGIRGKTAGEPRWHMLIELVDSALL